MKKKLKVLAVVLAAFTAFFFINITHWSERFFLIVSVFLNLTLTVSK